MVEIGFIIKIQDCCCSNILKQFLKRAAREVLFTDIR